MRLIDADALKEDHGMKNDCADCDKELRGKSRSCMFERLYALMDFCVWLDDAPTIEPERKTGKAIVKSTGYRGHWACDQCGTEINSTDNFCRHCGADLRGKK